MNKYLFKVAKYKSASSELLINYKNNLLSSNTRVYGLNYNILNIKNGMGGVAYSN